MATPTAEQDTHDEDQADATLEVVEPFLQAKVSKVRTVHDFNEARQVVVHTTTFTTTCEWTDLDELRFISDLARAEKRVDDMGVGHDSGGVLCNPH